MFRVKISKEFLFGISDVDKWLSAMVFGLGGLLAWFSYLLYDSWEFRSFWNSCLAAKICLRVLLGQAYFCFVWSLAVWVYAELKPLQEK